MGLASVKWKASEFGLNVRFAATKKKNWWKFLISLLKIRSISNWISSTWHFLFPLALNKISVIFEHNNCAEKGEKQMEFNCGAIKKMKCQFFGTRFSMWRDSLRKKFLFIYLCFSFSFRGFQKGMRSSEINQPESVGNLLEVLFCRLQEWLMRVFPMQTFFRLFVFLSLSFVQRTTFDTARL